MGTRNLICVVDENGEYRVAKYCQWDGYPEGQGKKVYNFVSNPDNLKALSNALNIVEEIDPARLESYWKQCGSKGDGWVTCDVADKFREQYPHLHRDMGGEILQYIVDLYNNGVGVIEVSNDLDFANDGLMCEWCYLVDLRSRTFEVYKGFNKSEVGENARFNGPPDKYGYYPVALLKLWKFDELPATVEDFFQQVEDALPKTDEDDNPIREIKVEVI